MNVLIVHAHNEPQSFTRALCDQACETLAGHGHAVQVSDLYAMNWNPVASAADFAERADPDYLVYALEQRESVKRQSLAADIQAELDKLLWAQYQKGDNDALGFANSAANPLVHYGKYVEERTIGLELNIPIYSGGLTSSQVRESYQRLNQSEQSREGQRRQVVQDTRNLHRAVNTDVEQVQARRQAIISNQSSLEATEIGYQVGTRNIVDVLNAQRQLYAAVRDYNNSRYDYILDTLRLKQAAGTLSPADLEALSAYLKQDYDPDKDFLPPDLAKAAAEQLQSKPRQQY